jgi:phospholipid/cholesterol/gamma-HCH transport system ATP-binding protein
MHGPGNGAAGTYAGFVLVGGGSKRMGQDKALLPVGSDVLVTRIAKIVAAAAGSVALVGNPDRYNGTGFPVIADLYPGFGPVGGIVTALSNTPAEWNLVVACDMPNVTVEFLASLLAVAVGSEAQCVIPVTPDGRHHPLCAVYRRSAFDVLKQAVERNIHRLLTAIEPLSVRSLPVSTPEVLVNVNTPDEWKCSRMQPTEQFPHYIEFRHVYKTFDRPVLVDTNFNVNAGETVAIIGRSGVGKSVTLSHIMGFLKPDQGRVIVAHQDITDMSESELRLIRRKVTMVFQNGALFDSLTVAENILFSLELREDYDDENKETVVNGLLSMVDLLDAKDAYPSELSTGYKRAVAIARALAAQPECILYDEPTTMVDPIMSDHLGNLMLRLKSQLKLTSVVVTHDLDLMWKVADRVVFLFEGRVIFFGPAADLEKSDHPHIQEFLAMDRVDLSKLEILT